MDVPQSLILLIELISTFVFFDTRQQSIFLINLSGVWWLNLEHLSGRCTLITSSPGWLTPTGGFFIKIECY